MRRRRPDSLRRGISRSNHVTQSIHAPAHAGGITPTLRSFAALLVALVLAGCGEITEPFRGRPENPYHALRAGGAAANGLPRLMASVQLSDRTIVSGRVVPLTLSLTNHERLPIDVYMSPCDLWYVVYDRHGTQVSSGCAGGFPTPERVTLQPGQSVERTASWQATTFDYDNGVIEVPLAPGPYRIHAYFNPGWPLPWDTYLSPPHVVQVVGEQRPQRLGSH